MANSLIHETSPYLLQHADHPVEWRAWSEEAFALARTEDKLVFLSIGYSTCHWCHVMAHASFENGRVAAVMNRQFINVKVDREERPDIDAIYMPYVQATTGQGGWPMSVWLTPDGKPVFGGTYFPPDDAFGRPGFARVCAELARLWRDERPEMEDRAARAMEYLRRLTSEVTATRELPDGRVHADFVAHCDSMFDTEWGGFGGAPKFPRPAIVRTLMQLSDRFGRESAVGTMAWNMSTRTLRTMAAGGMHDQLGGGFHRYSVDRFWHVPHYEKMLYDQAQLAMAYLDAWQISGDVLFRHVTEGIFRYLLESMRDGGGAFHAAEDADSLPAPDARHHREGAFWTWRDTEISSLLAPRDAEVFRAAFGVRPEGNARPESDPHGELKGQNTLFRAMNDEALATMFGCPENEIRERIAVATGVLTDARNRRPQPHRDDKIVTAWNGLAIGALARGARVFGRGDLTHAAHEAAGFLHRELWDGERLFRSHRGRRGQIAAFPADYVYLISGLTELHAVTPEAGWLAWARRLQQKLDDDFLTATKDGYVMRPGLAGETLMEIHENHDGAEPAPNHLAAENLLKLAALCDEPEYFVRARDLIGTGSQVFGEAPIAAPVLLAAFDLFERGVMKFRIPAAADPAVVKLLRTSYFPRAVFTPGDGGEVTVCEGVTCRRFPEQGVPFSG